LSNNIAGRVEPTTGATESSDLRPAEYDQTPAATIDKSPVRVCLISLNYPPEQTSVAPYSGGLAAALAASGHQVTAVVAHPHYPDWEIWPGYGDWRTVEHLDGVRVDRRLHYVPQPPRGIRRLLSEISFGMRLVFTRLGSTDVTIALSPALFATALVALRLKLTPRRSPLIVWVQDIYALGLAETGEGGGIAQSIARFVEGRTLRAADRVVVLHQRFADFVTTELGVDPARVVVHRNWTHLPPSDPVDPSYAKAALGWPTDKTLAVHTGNMGAKQGLENFLDAARLADLNDEPIHFILVGDGGERRHLEEYGRGISRLSFVDPLDDEKYHLALNAADVLVVNEKPGVSAMSMPCKMTSYFDAAKPVVAATDLNGITASEITMANAGLVVPAGNAEALLDAIKELRNHPADAAVYGRSGRAHREAVLDHRIAMDNWRALVGSVVDKGPRSNRH
jgi:colanic acid biosynthesis glycosyl transferase WcaI